MMSPIDKKKPFLEILLGQTRQTKIFIQPINVLIKLIVTLLIQENRPVQKM